MNELLEVNQEAVAQHALDAGEIPAFLDRQEAKDIGLEVLDEGKALEGTEEQFVQLVDDIH